MQEFENWKETLGKLSILVPGVVLGLSVKLSKLNKDNKLTWGNGIYHSCVALGTAYVMYYILNYVGYKDLAPPAAFVCSRFGDELLIFLWKWVITTLQTFLKQTK